MDIKRLTELSQNIVKLPEFTTMRVPEGCNDCCCDLGCETYS